MRWCALFDGIKHQIGIHLPDIAFTHLRWTGTFDPQMIWFFFYVCVRTWQETDPDLNLEIISKYSALNWNWRISRLGFPLRVSLNSLQPAWAFPSEQTRTKGWTTSYRAPEWCFLCILGVCLSSMFSKLCVLGVSLFCLCERIKFPTRSFPFVACVSVSIRIAWYFQVTDRFKQTPNEAKNTIQDLHWLFVELMIFYEATPISMC